MTPNEVEKTLKVRLADSVKSAKKRTGDASTHSLTLEELIEVYNSQGGLCAELGIPLTGVEKVGTKYVNDNRWTGLSIDRLDCSKGYHADNVRLTCWVINAMRGVLSEEEAKRQTSEFIETVRNQCAS